MGRDDDEAGEAQSKNMRLVGFVDLQSRSAYQPRCTNSS